MFQIRLKKLREDMKISQYEFARRLKVAQSTVGGWESGKREPNFTTMQTIANFFNVSTDYLLGRTDDPTPPNAEEPTERELEELIKENPLVFNGVPLNDEDKQDILDVMRVAWKTIQKRKQK